MFKQMQKPFTGIMRLLICFAAMIFVSTSSADNHASDAETARATALAAQADVLAPNSFRKAEQLNSKGAPDAATAYAEALAKAATAANAFEELLVWRNRADTAGAAQFAETEWTSAEKTFVTLTSQFEKRGSPPTASRADKSKSLYDKAELTAIINATLLRARGAESLARVGNAQRYAPKTFGQATELLEQAETVIRNDRTDTATAKKLAMGAETTFKHSMQVAIEVDRIRSDKGSYEDIILAWEERLQVINGAAGNEYDSLQSWDDVTANLVTYIEEGQTEIEMLRDELDTSRRYVAGLEDELREMDKKLGGTVAERDQLIFQQQEQQRRQERIRLINERFSNDEATVLRKGNDIILRLQDMRFASGSSELSDQALNLLAKTGDIIDNFPDALIRIEGHTDATGSVAVNARVSQERADAVMRYMVSDLRIPARRLTAEGLGSSQPVGLNSTAEGRAKNRRIDVVITPAPNTTAF